MTSAKTHAPVHQTKMESSAESSCQIPITVPAGMHGVVFIEFQGQLRKSVELRFLKETRGSSEIIIEKLVERYESCYGNVAASILLRGSKDGTLDYSLALSIYAGQCCMHSLSDAEMPLAGPSRIGDSENGVSAYTYLYHPDEIDPFALGADLIIVGTVIQEGIAPLEVG